MNGSGRRAGAVVLGCGLLVALAVAMFVVSGPARDSSGGPGLRVREEHLSKGAGSLVLGVSGSHSPAVPALLGVPELRYEGQVLRVPVSSAWDALSFSERKAVVDRIVGGYVALWQREMKSQDEPAIVFVEGDRRVALHTRVDHWILGAPSAISAPGG